MERIIFHIDVNNAFLSWSALDLLNKGYKYDIRNSYAVIGGDESKRSGIVLAKSSSAKKLGIVTGETLYSARKKCKVLRTYYPNYKWYQEMSSKLFELISKYTNDFEVASIDECYMDYTKIKHIYGDEVEFAYKLKKEIYDKLKFTVNIGIANNKLCAKMASDFTKPYKVHTLYDSEIKEKMYPLDISDLFGIGKKTVPKLRKLNINKIGDLANFNLEELSKYFKNQAIKMINSAKGINDDPVKSVRDDRKCISNETTLEKDFNDKEEMYIILRQISDNLARVLRRENKYCNVVEVHLKDNMFKSFSHQKKLNNATNLTDEIYKISKELLNEMYNGESIRLIGIRLDKLVNKSNHQVSLFEEINDRDDNIKLEKVIDSLKEKYGKNIIDKATIKKRNITKKYEKD